MMATTIHTSRGTRQSFTTRHRDLTSILELQSRCYAAARLATQSANYGPEDRADMATSLLCELWEQVVSQNLAVSGRFKVPTSLSGEGAVIYSAMSRPKSKDSLTLWAEIPAIRATDGPKFSTLYGKACNLRRSLDSERARDANDAAERAAMEGFLPFTLDADPEVRSTPEAAHALAHEMAVAVGLDPRRPVYVAAYTAARATSGEESAVIACELEMQGPAYRKALQRGRDAIAAAFDHPHLLAEALYVPDGGVALKPSASRMRAASIGDRDTGWRDSQRAYGIRPVGVSVVQRDILPCAPPEWALALKGTTGHRLRQAAANRALRSSMKGSAERASDRMSAGLPPEVPSHGCA